jgi:arylesterase/paraoxonase
MRKLFRLLFRLIAAVVLLSVVATAVLAWRGHWFRDVQPEFAGECEALELPGSAEDILVDRPRGLAYLSVLDRRALARKEPAQGAVMRVNLNARPLVAEPALADPPDHFRPHGLSLYVGPDGVRHLFVINHPVNRGEEPEMVELFRESEPGLFSHVETFSDPLMNSPNDLVAVGPRQFYIANDKVLGGGLAGALQQFGIGASPLTYVDGRDARVALDNIASGGGINVSADGTRLYVAETSAQRIRVLERDPASGNVSELDRISIGTSPDNVDVAADGSLWIGAHANVLKLIQHFAAGKAAPSQVLRIGLDQGRVERIDDIFLDDGSLMQASSVGVNYDNLVLVGSITEKKMLVCTLP